VAADEEKEGEVEGERTAIGALNNRSNWVIHEEMTCEERHSLADRDLLRGECPPPSARSPPPIQSAFVSHTASSAM